MINKLILKNSISLIPFLSMIILTLGCSNKTAEKEMKMPMLFDTRDQAEKKHINLVEKELIKWGINGCHVVCTNIKIKTSVLSHQCLST